MFFRHVRNCRMKRAYETSLNKFLYLRLREGFTIKHIHQRNDDLERIVIKMSLPWKPQILIEYVINALWSDDLEKKFFLIFFTIMICFLRCKIYVEVFIDAIFSSTIELLNELNESESIKLTLQK